MTDEQQPDGVPEVFTPEQSEAPGSQVPAGETDAPETETDEQRNERVLRERQAASERRARGVQKRFDELTRDKYAERARAERAEREIELLRQHLQPRQQQSRSEEQPPQRNDFDDYESYLEARAEWRAVQKFRALEDQREAQAREQQARQQFETSVARDHEAIALASEKFRSQVQDYDEVVESLDFVAPPAMQRAIADSENPAAVLYALGKQPGIARQIASLDPVRQAKAIGAIEAFLRTQASSPQVSKAPPPGNPVGGKPNASSTRDPMKARTVEEFMKLREAQVRAERGR